MAYGNYLGVALVLLQMSLISCDPDAGTTLDDVSGISQDPDVSNLLQELYYRDLVEGPEYGECVWYNDSARLLWNINFNQPYW